MKAEAPGCSHPRNRRRRESEKRASGILSSLSLTESMIAFDARVLTLALIPWLQRHEHEGAVGCVRLRKKAVTHDGACSTARRECS